jgi:hypothetical protein
MEECFPLWHRVPLCLDLVSSCTANLNTNHVRLDDICAAMKLSHGPRQVRREHLDWVTGYYAA